MLSVFDRFQIKLFKHFIYYKKLPIRLTKQQSLKNQFPFIIQITKDKTG